MRASMKGLLVAPTSVAALFLGACGSPTANSNEVQPFDLKDSTAIAQLCGQKAVEVTAVISDAESANENSGRRNQISDWGLDPSNTEAITATKTAVQAQTHIKCGPDGLPLSPALNPEQQAAANACLTEEERNALKPEDDATTAFLLNKCKDLGEKVFQELSDTNKAVTQTAALAKELKETDNLLRASFIAIYMSEAQKIDSKGVTVSDSEALAAQIRAFLPNADEDDVLVGSKGVLAVQHDKHEVETGGAPFYDGNNITYMETTQDIAKYFASGAPGAKVAREHVLNAVGKSEETRALTGAGYIPLQLKDASQILGTSYFQDGKVKTVGQWRESRPGDLYWLYITADGILIPEATLRADCFNVGAKTIRIVKPGIATAVSISRPVGKEVCPKGTVLKPNGECHVPPPPPPPVKTPPPVVKTPPPPGKTPPPPVVTTPPPPPPAVCPPDKPYGVYPVCKDGVEKAPQNQGNLPQQQMPNPLPAAPEHHQPVEPVNPPPVYTPPPAPPAPEPAPVVIPKPGGGGGTVIVPPPSPNPPGPRPIPPPESAAPAPSDPPTTCVPAPGKTTC